MSAIDTAYSVGRTLWASLGVLADSARGRLDAQALAARVERWSSDLVERAEIDLRIEGLNRVDWSRAYVVMSNHASHFDIPVLYQVMRGRGPMLPVAKKELFRVPLFGAAMRQAGVISVDRGNRERAIESLREAHELLASGTHVWIAPEGTRSKDGALGAFKKGGFHIAKETGTPILPIKLAGTHAILPPGTAVVRRGVRVTAQLSPPIAPSGTIEELMAAVAARLG